MLHLLPAAVDDVRQPGPRRPWILRYGGREAVLRATDVEGLRALGFTPEQTVASIEWLHKFLRDLGATGFRAPVPIDELDGRSVVLQGDVAWELLSFVPGQPMGWTDAEMEQAGGLLAGLHGIVARLPQRDQRPGALPIENCRPSDPVAHAIRIQLERELTEIGHDRAPRAVVHGDATQANVVVHGVDYALVDYTIAYEETPLFDIASALWRNGRVDANAVVYDPRRAARFVGGYHRTRPLHADDARAIVVYMKARGLQLQHRLERRRGTDETVLQRLQAVVAQENDLVEALRAEIGRQQPLIRV